MKTIKCKIFSLILSVSLVFAMIPSVSFGEELPRIPIRIANSYTSEPAPVKNLIYTGNEQTIMTQGSATGGTVLYRISETREYSSALPKVTAAGTYTVYYKVNQTDSYYAITEKSTTVTVSAATDNEYTKKPAGKVLSYKGKAQELVSAGKAKYGEIQYRLGEEGEYSKSLPKATEAGKYTVWYKVVTTSNYNGISEDSIDITIEPQTISEMMLSNTTYTYNGKAVKPAITVKAGNIAINSTDYKVAYYSAGKDLGKSPVDVGKYTVKVTGTGNYSGMASKSIIIKPAGTSILRVAAAKRAFTVKWKKPSTGSLKQITGYQLQYSTNKAFKSKVKTVLVSKASVAKKISRLAKKKIYYVRIRTYKKGGFNSDWSKIKYIRVK